MNLYGAYPRFLNDRIVMCSDRLQALKLTTFTGTVPLNASLERFRRPPKSSLTMRNVAQEHGLG